MNFNMSNSVSIDIKTAEAAARRGVQSQEEDRVATGDILDISNYVQHDPQGSLDPVGLWEPINKSKKTGDFSTLRRLLASGVDPNLPTGPNEVPPLVYVIEYMIGSEPEEEARGCEILKILLDAGSNPNLGDRMGYTPLYYAVLCGFVDYIPILIKAHADINKLSRSQNIFQVLSESKEVLEDQCRYDAMAEFLKKWYPEMAMDHWMK
jgi:hypothetical protein